MRAGLLAESARQGRKLRGQNARLLGECTLERFEWDWRRFEHERVNGSVTV
jgi:hypothetical protein